MLRPALLSLTFAAALGGCSDVGQNPTTATSPAMTTTSSAASATTSAGVSPEQVFTQMLKDQGFLKSDGQKNLLLMKAGIYCRSLQEGMTREQTLASTGLPGSAARTEAEAILRAAVLTICPDQATAK